MRAGQKKSFNGRLRGGVEKTTAKEKTISKPPEILLLHKETTGLKKKL